MGELAASLIEFFAEIALGFQQLFFKKKLKERRAYEKANNLPPKKMISPYRRVTILVVVLSLIATVFYIVNTSKVDKNKTEDKAVENSYILASAGSNKKINTEDDLIYN